MLALKFVLYFLFYVTYQKKIHLNSSNQLPLPMNLFKSIYHPFSLGDQLPHSRYIEHRLSKTEHMSLRTTSVGKRLHYTDLCNYTLWCSQNCLTIYFSEHTLAIKRDDCVLIMQTERIPNKGRSTGVLLSATQQTLSTMQRNKGS